MRARHRTRQAADAARCSSLRCWSPTSLFFAWTHGWLDDVVGVRAGGDREPERLARQVRPELDRACCRRSAAASAAGRAGRPASRPARSRADEIGGAEPRCRPRCRPPAQLAPTVKAEQPGQWIVYMGKYPNREALQKKVEELKRRNVEYDEVRSPPALDGGLSLGRFDDRAGAERRSRSSASRASRLPGSSS